MNIIWIQERIFVPTFQSWWQKEKQTGKEGWDIYKFDSQYKACGMYKVTVLEKISLSVVEFLCSTSVAQNGRTREMKNM